MSNNKTHIYTIPNNSTKWTKKASNIPIPKIPSILHLPKIRLIFDIESLRMALKSPRFLEICFAARAFVNRRTFHPTQNRKKNVLSKDETLRSVDSFRPKIDPNRRKEHSTTSHPQTSLELENRRNREMEKEKKGKMESRNCVPDEENRPNNRISQNRLEFRPFLQRIAAHSNSIHQKLCRNAPLSSPFCNISAVLSTSPR